MLVFWGKYSTTTVAPRNFWSTLYIDAVPTAPKNAPSTQGKLGTKAQY